MNIKNICIFHTDVFLQDFPKEIEKVSMVSQTNISNQGWNVSYKILKEVFS